MNEFPQFHPGEPALTQLSSVRLNKVSLGQKGNQIQPGTGYRVTQTAGGTTVSGIKRRVATPALPPLTPTLKFLGDTIIANVSYGYVNERVAGVGEAVYENEIQYLDVDPPTDFPVAIGDQISVVVYVKATGELGGDAAPSGYVALCTIEAEDTESTHYIPPCGDDQDGSDGIYHYKIGVVRDVDDNHNQPWVEMFLAGSHIDHFSELPLIDNYYIDSDPGRGSVVGKYDPGDNKYKFRQIDPKYGLIIAQTEDTIRVDFDTENTGGADGCKVLNLPTDDPLPNEKAKFRQIRHLNSTEEGIEEIDHQINVEIVDGQDSPAGALDTIRIRGNGKKATFTFMGRDSLGGFEERGVINFQDGLCTDSGPFTIDMADYLSEGL